MAPTTIPGAGLLKGFGVTLKTMFRGPVTQMYPHERPTLAPRTRGVIALMDENCTVCMLCARECPDWCIYIDSHKETVPPATEGGRARTRNVLDRFAIDFALCMYCGICIEVCPFDALWWSPEFEYAEYAIDGLLHEKERLREWADTVLPPPELDEGAIRPAEVVSALEKHAADLAKAEQAALEAEKGDQAGDATGDVPEKREVPEKPTLAAVELEGETQMDQEVFDGLVADGKSERMARAKAKAAWVKAEKAKKLDDAIAAWEKEVAEVEEHNRNVEEQRTAAASAAGGAGDAPVAGAGAPSRDVPPKPTLANVELDEDPQVDQEVFDQLVADGKSERMARAKAKAAWVKARKQSVLDEQLEVWEREYGSGAGDDADAAGAAQGAAEPTLGDVRFEGEVEIDQEVYDQLIADGKSERIARSKAKAAYVKAQKRKQMDAEAETEGGGDAAADASGDAGDDGDES